MNNVGHAIMIVGGFILGSAIALVIPSTFWRLVFSGSAFIIGGWLIMAANDD